MTGLHRMVLWDKRAWRFRCIPGCALCCDGDWLGPEHPQRPDGKCVHLDMQGRCSIYAARPRYCRSFPFFELEDGRRMVWLDCPGVTARHR